ncbi:putative Lysine-specific demethylase 4B [Hypsibius exemplaris]|uniref:Lysine-specific demethylase 4B n=1 Tax=Hypsibius exemplaris TaxID=2072580 RepID=A0A1W0XBR8_HYPEX|nr:putative Lysine-specific demethylase 4B [Hypsibius exemplaris]
MAAAEAALGVLNCITIRPTMEEFRDELAFLSSKVVQDAGKERGIVRVVCPREFEPSRPPYTEEDAAANPSLWTRELPVLQQLFPRLETPMAKGKEGMFVVERRQAEQEQTNSKEWQRRAQNEKARTMSKMRDAQRKEALRKGDKNFVPLDYEKPHNARRLYWDSRPYQRVAYYGADVSDSCMRHDLESWNFNSPTFPCLTNMFDTERTPGVYTPYLYIGSWGSSFGMHPEDKDLYSLSYLHEGEAKFWYGMPSSSSAAVEEFAAELLPEEASSCAQFLRHKTLIIAPEYFLKRGIQVYAAEQKEGDLIITFPNAYHYGFNNGFNVAEARNIATKDWIPFGLKAESCQCETYQGADVLPYERIVEMAKKADPEKYAHLVLKRPSDEDYVDVESLMKRVKKAVQPR